MGTYLSHPDDLENEDQENSEENRYLSFNKEKNFSKYSTKSPLIKRQFPVFETVLHVQLLLVKSLLSSFF